MISRGSNRVYVGGRVYRFGAEPADAVVQRVTMSSSSDSAYPWEGICEKCGRVYRFPAKPADAGDEDEE